MTPERRAKMREASRRWRERKIAEDPNYYRDSMRRWRENNPEKYRAAQFREKLRTCGLLERPGG